MGLMDALGRLARRSRETRSLPQAAATPVGPLSRLEPVPPMDALAASLVFPLCFEAGQVPFRARVTALSTGPDAFDRAPPEGPWFRWKAETPSGALGGFWCLPVAGTAAGFAPGIASAAAAALKASLAGIPALVPASFGMGPCPAPALSGRSVFRVDFRWLARGKPGDGVAFCATGLPALLRAGLESAEARGAVAEPEPAGAADPIAAMAAASALLARTLGDRAWSSRGFGFDTADGRRVHLPLYELFNLLSDGDLRLVIQNHLAARVRGGRFGALFLYARTDASGERRVAAPLSWDHGRNDPLFPAAVLEDGWLDASNAAPDADAFLRNNDEACGSLAAAMRSGRLELSPAGAALVRAVYLGQARARKREEFDALVRADSPMSSLAACPERIFRRAVDASGSRALAAAVYGSPAGRARVERWCSSRKRADLASDLAWLERCLGDGSADLDALVAERMALAAKAAAVEAAGGREPAGI